MHIMLSRSCWMGRMATALLAGVCVLLGPVQAALHRRPWGCGTRWPGWQTLHIDALWDRIQRPMLSSVCDAWLAIGS